MQTQDLSVPDVDSTFLLNYNVMILERNLDKWMTPWHIGARYPKWMAEALIARGGVGGDGGSYATGACSLAQRVQHSMSTLIRIFTELKKSGRSIECSRTVGSIYVVYDHIADCSRRKSVPQWRMI